MSDSDCHAPGKCGHQASETGCRCTKIFFCFVHFKAFNSLTADVARKKPLFPRRELVEC